MNPKYNYNDRKDFLIQMYNQLSSEIDRHIRIIWQTVGLLISAFAIFALVEKNILPIDLAASILILVSGLSLAIIIESNYWYNRNLVIIANIEKQFLLESDTRDIHNYFASHRRNNAYLDMMIIQIVFILILLGIVILYHFSVQVYPFIKMKNLVFAPMKTVPYIVITIGSIVLKYFHKKRVNDYNNFLENSPGIEISNKGEVDPNSDHKT